MLKFTGKDFVKAMRRKRRRFKKYLNYIEPNSNIMHREDHKGIKVYRYLVEHPENEELDFWTFTAKPKKDGALGIYLRALARNNKNYSYKRMQGVCR